MTSTPPPKSSKRKDVGKAIRRGYDRFKQVIQPSSQLSSQNTGSPFAPSVGASSAPPAQSTASGPAIAPSVPPQGTSAAGQTTGFPAPGSNQAVTTTNTTLAVPKPTTVAKFRRVGNVTLSGLESVLQVLETSAEVFPPLRSAVSGFIDCLDIVRAAARSSEEYEELTVELTTMADTLNKYLSELGSEDPSGSAARIALSIEAEVAYIAKQRGRGKGRRMVESAEEKEDVIKCYRRIEGLFRQLQGDMVIQIWRNTNKLHVTTLLRGMSPVDDARYNSSYSTIIKRRGCTPETREKVQAGLQEWSQDPNAAKVYWMNGMAGTGKTTIAYSLCEQLEANQQLGASFFCSRVSPSCRNVHLLVPTIAYQLARYSPSFRSALCKILEEDPDAGKLNVVWQFKKLVQQPMQAAGDSIPEGVVVVIDALDECEDVHGVRLVLETLLRLAADLPLKFFVTSRPEPEVRDKMLSPGGYSPSVLHLHDIEQSIVEEDIKKYLVESFSSMSSPPSTEQIEQLAKRAGKLFIYAATVVRYILPGRGSVNPTARLNAMLTADSQPVNKGQSNKRYRELDELYTTILVAAFNEEELEEEELEAMRLVLRTAICAKEPMTAPTMASLLGLTEEQVSSALHPLRSVLHVSESGGLISTLHASFPDYMLDHSRSGHFYCDLAQHSGLLAHRCFDVMKEQLRFNICGLESSFIFDKDVPSLEQRVKSCISNSLFYACQYWGEHLQLAGGSDVLRDKLADLLTQRLLFWMEVLNLNLCIVKGIMVLVRAEGWLQTTNITTGDLVQVSDARDFVTRFAAGACVRCTPHIYLSALPFCARSNSVYAHYWKRAHGLIGVKGTAISRRDRAAQATWVTDSMVDSVAFSPDGTRIASGSEDTTIQLWDIHTGDVIAGPFKAHTSSVFSVAFSPDGTRIASGSYDQTIRVWDTRTGDVTAGPFRGHMSPINSVAFSPDGSCVASGSDDETIRVWDSRTGDVIAGPFEGHTELVNSVSFSPDSTCVVSGSYDHTIRVWGVYTSNTTVGPFEGHTDSVNSVAFSPDGISIASGSSDMTIRVWNARTGDIVAGPFEGHTNWVNAVVFSLDGTRIVSGSDDHTIRVWDACTGNVVAGPFEGHTDSVNSVAFSPDGARIISGSRDQTIRVWDARASANTAEPLEGHKDSVSSVAFSSDGTRIASGSYDHTIRVWDARTGGAVTGPFEGHTSSVVSIAFSPDGTQIVSGSADRTIRVWEAYTGNAAARPFEGHTSLISSVVFSPDGTRIASGSYDQTIRVWDACSNFVVAGLFKGHEDAVRSVAFSPDSTRIVSGSHDRTIRVWDSRTGDVVAGPFEGHTSMVRSVAFSPDGTRIVSGSADLTVRVWNACTGEVVAGPSRGHTNSINAVAFSPDGTRIVSGSDDYTIRVWNAHTGDTDIGPFEGHTNLVWSVAFSPDGTSVVSGSYDHTIRVWDVRTDEAATTPSKEHKSLVNPAASSFNVNRMVVSGTVQPDRIHNGLIAIATTDFKSNNDGWITANNVPLFWVSPDFRAYVPHPRNTLVIGPQGTACIDYRHLTLGESWSRCYISQ